MPHRSPDTSALPALLSAPRLREAILGSWQRCRAAGLDMDARPDATLLTHGELAARRDASGAMLHIARPLLQSLQAQVADAGQVAVICDADGLILESLGDAAFLRDAERVALKPGACWSELTRGTNAIGTGIATGAAVRVHGDEHYIRRHHRLSCSAAPFHDASGRLAGLIDVSGPPARAPHDLLHRVCETTAILEQQLFLAAWPGANIVALHADAARLGMPDAQLLAVDGDGMVLGMSRSRHALPADVLRHWREDGIGRLLDGLRRARAPQRLADIRLHAQVLTWADRRPPPLMDVTPPVPAPHPEPAPLPGVGLRLVDTAQRLFAADIPVLLQGETGTGKDVLARWLHEHGPLAAKPFVAINCAAIPETLIEAELFGYEEGAFTGARRKGMPGRLVEADGGVLFLDEIGDMPLAMQTRLLRVLQDRMVHPLGGGRPRQASFRLICATHRDLPALVAAGSFRADLFYRINHYPLTLPPLRARPGVGAIIDSVAEHHGARRRGITMSSALRTALETYAWPGNLRQLDNLLATLMALCNDGDVIEAEDLPADLFAAMALPEVAEDAPSTDCDTLIRLHGGASAAARAMGVSRSTFYRRLRQQRAGA